ncbi:hypothetical protein [Streptomyces sp. NPDC021139]|uniref:hypothetical protein n=1 Tax=unclassified Streptomyces TaxID=2593676 RepID=UPI00340D9550
MLGWPLAFPGGDVRDLAFNGWPRMRCSEMQVDASEPQRGRFDFSAAAPSVKLWCDVYNVENWTCRTPEPLDTVGTGIKVQPYACSNGSNQP